MNHDDRTTDTLLQFVAGCLDPDESTVIEAHIRDCLDCAASVRRARAIADVLREQRAMFQASPAGVAQMAVDLFGQVRPDLVRMGAVPDASGFASLASRLRRIVADLTFDSFGAPAFAGLRAASRTSRHLAFQSELGDLDLQVTSPLRSSAPEARWHVMGQLDLPDPLPEGTAIRFVSGDISGDDSEALPADAFTSAAIDASGYFSVELRSGAWAALLIAGETVVVFPGISL